MSATEERATILIRMPAKLKEKIARDAFKNESNLTATIVGLLADHYGVKYTRPNNRTMPFGGGHRK